MTQVNSHSPKSRRTINDTPATPVLSLRAAIPVAALGGIAMNGAFPALGWWPLAFVALILSLLTFIGRSMWGAVLVGGIFGAGFWFPHVAWAAQFLGDHPLRWVPWVALASIQAIFMAALAPLITLAYRWLPRLRNTWPMRLIALPALVAGAWILRELIMGSWPYGGFPWGRVGMSQSESPFAVITSWVGVTGLGFLMVVACAGAIEAICFITHTRRELKRRELERTDLGKPARAHWLALIPTGALIVAMLLIPQFPTAHAGTMRVGAVQGDGPAAYMDERDANAVLDSQLEASAPLAGEEVDIVLWPEGGVDSDPLANEATAQTLNGAVEQYNAPILLNAASTHDDVMLNTSFLWTEDGPTASHSKRHPVPFGEYVPNRSFYSAIAPSLVNMLQREYAAGTDVPVIDVAGMDVGLAICFDVVFDDVIREGAQSGAQILMFQTNNADFRGTDENLQQLAFARMRAIETGRSAVNLSTTGTSQMFAPDGSIVAELPVDEPGHMVADLELRDGVTPGILLGQPIEILIAVSTLATLGVLALIALHTRRKTRA